MGVVVCNSCNGTGKVPGHDDDKPSNRAKTHPIVWFFGLNGALFAAVLKPLNADWFVNGVLGFVVVGMAAGFLMGRTYGKIILAVLGLGILTLFGFAIYMAETGQIE